jgi:hypothetical protein
MRLQKLIPTIAAVAWIATGVLVAGLANAARNYEFCDPRSIWYSRNSHVCERSNANIIVIFTIVGPLAIPAYLATYSRNYNGWSIAPGRFPRRDNP